MTFEARFLVALAVTVVLETAVLALAVRLTRAPEKYAILRVIAAGILASTLTLPYLWFILPRFVNGPWFAVLGESLVVLIETPVLALVLPATAWRALALSLVCNVASWLAGPPIVTAILRRL